MISRRDIFVQAAQLAAAGVFITSLPTKLIAAALEVASDDYDVALDLAKQVIEHTKAYRAAIASAPDVPLFAQYHRDQVCEIGDRLYGFLCDKFPPTVAPEDIAAFRAIFYVRDASQVAWQREPRVAFGAVFAIAILKELICRHRAPFQLARMKNANRFGELYHDVIMA